MRDVNCTRMILHEIDEDNYVECKT